jgi:hypothetical protein
MTSRTQHSAQQWLAAINWAETEEKYGLDDRRTVEAKKRAYDIVRGMVMNSALPELTAIPEPAKPTIVEEPKAQVLPKALALPQPKAQVQPKVQPKAQAQQPQAQLQPVKKPMTRIDFMRQHLMKRGSGVKAAPDLTGLEDWARNPDSDEDSAPDSLS